MLNRKPFFFLPTVVFAGACVSSLCAQPAYPTHPNQAQLICSDVEHFVKAQAMIAAGEDPVAALQAHYFDAGSPGLVEFLTRHEMSASQLVAAMEERPETYAKISSWLETIESLRAGYVTQLENYQAVLPDAMFPPTYFLVGDYQGIAQASRPGQLITITRVLDRPDLLFNITLHELTHFQQARKMGFQKYIGLYAQKDNLLALVLREGGAEFVAYLVSGRVSQGKALTYFDANAEELKARFQQDLENQDAKFWLWETLDQTETPALLGYVMGFKICQAYYDAAPDKTVALDTILRMEDPTAFLAASGYLQP